MSISFLYTKIHMHICIRCIPESGVERNAAHKARDSKNGRLPGRSGPHICIGFVVVQILSLPLQLPPSLSSIQEAAMCVSFGSRICRDHIPHLLPCVITNNHPLSVMKLYIPNAHPTLSTSSCEGAGRQATGRKQAAAGAA